LKREAEVKRLQLCPIFNWQITERKIVTLPDEIDLSQTDLWEKDYLQEPGFEPEPVGIKPKEKFAEELNQFLEQLDFEEGE